MAISRLPEIEHMEGDFWRYFGIAVAFKILLMPAYHSTDFEVHRNWLAITHNLPLSRWYYDVTSEWTLDYPPFFAYFEWLLAKVAQFVDPQMLLQHNHNYASELTKRFQRGSVIAVEVIYALGAWYCLKVLRVVKTSHKQFTAEILLLLNVGLIFVDHIHFQYNGFMFGILILSISWLLQERYLLGACAFAVLLNFKHLFVYLAPAIGVYLLKFYVFDKVRSHLLSLVKLAVVTLIPFVLSFGPFWQHLPQLYKRLFPFKRGLTHAYWAPNFWALYNVGDKIAAAVLKIPTQGEPSSTSGLVQEIKHVFLPTITPLTTFVLTAIFMLPVLIKLGFYTKKSDRQMMLFRAIILCACSSFMFGWHVHEKAILMCLIPITFLCILNPIDAKWALIACFTGYWSLFPLLFDLDLILVRYSLHIAYMSFMWAQMLRIHKNFPAFNWLETVYLWGFVFLPVYEFIISPVLGFKQRYPFMPLLLTSVYCALGICYFFIGYYLFTLGIKTDWLTLDGAKKPKSVVSKSKQKDKRKQKQKTK